VRVASRCARHSVSIARMNVATTGQQRCILPTACLAKERAVCMYILTTVRYCCFSRRPCHLGKDQGLSEIPGGGGAQQRAVQIAADRNKQGGGPTQ
jgi:hypothetical protein